MRSRWSLWLVAGLCWSWASPAGADPRWIRRSWTGDAGTTMTVVWHTDGDPDTVLQWGESEQYGSEVQGTTDELGGEPGTLHEATITGLEPDTVYHYRVGGPDRWSGDFWFRSGPGTGSCGSFRFVVGGDGRGGEIPLFDGGF